MLVFDTHDIGAKLLSIRKKMGFTQSEAAEKAKLSDRTYADIERGTVNMRVETLLRICNAFCITPDEVLTEESIISYQDDILDKLTACSPKERKTALQIIDVYLQSLE